MDSHKAANTWLYQIFHRQQAELAEVTPDGREVKLFFPKSDIEKLILTRNTRI